MTTLVPFSPTLAPNAPPFQFQATFDGTLYNCTVTWNIYGQRWYIDIVDQNGNLIAHLPLVGSSNSKPIASLTWSLVDGGTVVATTRDRHFYSLGSIVVLTISGASPDAYNVVAPVYVDSPFSFTYPLANNPGKNVVPGSFSYDINIVKGYFLSSLVWRILNGNLEINP